MVTEAPAARALLREASRRWPGRRTASDGILSSDAHKKQNPTSRHDRGDAVDLTHDPAYGVDAHRLAEELRQRCAAGLEGRIDEIISNRRIATAAKGWRWRPYRGANPHDKHAHFSLRRRLRNDESPFLSFLDNTEKRPEPKPEPVEDDMPVLVRINGEATVYLTDLLHGKRSLDSKAEVDALKAAGVRDAGVIPASLLDDVPALRG